MTIPVLPYIPSFGFKQSLQRQFIQNDLADGYFISRTQETPFSRADGVGSVSNYRGLNVFNVGWNTTNYGSGKLANQLWTFFMARLDNLNEPFYYYNCPYERSTPDLTGVDTVGRYYVKLKNPNQILNRELFRYCLYHYQLEFIECREFGTPVEPIIVPDILIWHSCPSAMALVGDDNDIWFATTLSSGYLEYQGETGNEDALYIIKLNPDTGDWEQVYLEVGDPDFYTHWSEPPIAMKSRNGITVLVLNSYWDDHIEIRVFSGETLINSYDMGVETEFDNPYSGGSVTPESLYIAADGSIHVLGYDISGSDVTACDIHSSDNGASWTETTIATINLGYSAGITTHDIVETTNGLFAFLHLRKSSSPYTNTLKVYKSTNGGSSWTYVSDPTFTGLVTSMTPGRYWTFTNVGTDLYVVTGNERIPDTGSGYLYGISVYKSTDDGANFSKTTVLANSSTDKQFYAGLIFDASGTLYLFACIYKTAAPAYSSIYVYKSTNNGSTWDFVSQRDNPTSHISFKATLIALKAGSRIYLTGYYPDIYQTVDGNHYHILGYLYSDDGCQTWTEVLTPFYDVTGGGATPP